MVDTANRHINVKPINVSWLFQEKQFQTSTGICQDFSPTTQLPHHNDTGIRVVAIHEANGDIKCVWRSKPANRVARPFLFRSTNRFQYAACILKAIGTMERKGSSLQDYQQGEH